MIGSDISSGSAILLSSGKLVTAAHCITKLAVNQHGYHLLKTQIQPTTAIYIGNVTIPTVVGDFRTYPMHSAFAPLPQEVEDIVSLDVNEKDYKVLSSTHHAWIIGNQLQVGDRVCIAGWPAVDGVHQYAEVETTITGVRNGRIEYNHLTSSGFSGGPVFVKHNPPLLVGVHVGRSGKIAVAVDLTKLTI